MKKIVKTLVAMMFFGGMVLTALANSQTANIPTFNVTLNGITVENSFREYPLLVYKGITYVPMTYSDCRFLNLETIWDNDTRTLYISKSNSNTTFEYNPYTTETRNENTLYPTICSFNVVVNGRSIDNMNEEYPLLQFRGITYFPLTWNFIVDEFNWNYNFSTDAGLNVTSASLLSSNVEKIPSCPTKITAIKSGENTADISWSAVSGATSYEVQYYKRETGAWITDADYKGGTSYTSTGLGLHDSYDYRVRAKNSAGASDWAVFTYTKYQTVIASVSSLARTDFMPNWPLENSFSISALDYYSGGGEHRGIDVNNSSPNEKVLCVADGYVYQAVNACKCPGANYTPDSTHPCGDLGNYVTIKHEINGKVFYSRYAHLIYNSITVKEGDTIEAGTPIGIMGTSGNSSGTHLHFLIYENSYLEGGRTLDFYLANTSTMSKIQIRRGIANQPSAYKDWLVKNGTPCDNSYYKFVFCPHSKTDFDSYGKCTLGCGSMYNYIVTPVSYTGKMLEDHASASEPYGKYEDKNHTHKKNSQITIIGQAYNHYENHLWYKLDNGRWMYHEYVEVTKPSVPNAPVGAKAVKASSNTATISWNPVSGATSYEVQYYKRETGTWITDADYKGGTSYTSTGLGLHDSYDYRVRAKNSAGASNWTTFTYTKTNSAEVGTVPASPSGVKAVKASSNTATISWNPVSGATSYEVQYYKRETGAWITDADYKGGTSYTSTGLGLHDSYDYRVRAKNSAGASNWTTFTYTKTNSAEVGTVPASPSGVKAVKASSNTATISWNPVSGATSYEVQYYKRETGAWITDADYKGGTSYTSTGLGLHDSYDYRVRAKNSAGASDWIVFTYTKS